MIQERSNTPGEPSWEDCREILDRLPQMPIAERVQAFENLIRSSSAEIRNQALHLGAAILSDGHLVDYLREEADAVLRNAGLEILKLRGSRSFAMVVDLLDDRDPDVALQAVLVLDHLKDPRALEPVRRLLGSSDTNLAQAAISAVGHLGDSRSVEDLIPFLSGDPWLQMASVEALGDLRSADAVPHLAPILPDLMAGPLAAEALARIGGPAAFSELAGYWLRFEEDLEIEVVLGLLAHVMEGLAKVPGAPEEFRQSLERRLGDPERKVSRLAARCLLALGPGETDTEALDTLAGNNTDHASLPPCLLHRPDLMPALFSRGGRYRAWAFLLSARYPEDTPRQALIRALGEVADGAELPAVAKAVSQLRNPGPGPALLGLYRRLPPEERLELSVALRRHRDDLLPLLAGGGELDPGATLVLLAALGEPAEELAAKITALPEEERRLTLSQVLERPDVIELLPWAEWLESSPETLGPLAATAAARCSMGELVPRLRELLESKPGAELVRAMGEMGDRQSVPVLRRLLDRESELGPLILDSLGTIGGTEARQILRGCLDHDDETFARLAYRALSVCATEEDEPLFREAVEHADWNVRLAAAEVLGRSSREENLGALARLVADPVSLVSQRALSYLEP